MGCGSRLVFSRYLSSPDWRRVRLRPKGDLRALALVANPSNLDSYKLASLDVPAAPLEECLDGFWSPGLSPARLRALASAPDAGAPDLLLRMFPPPPVQVRGKDLAGVLAQAYQRLGADDADGPRELA